MSHAPTIVISSVLALGLGSAGSAQAGRVQEATVSATSPALGLTSDLVFPARDGEQIRLSDFAGKRVLLVTWASW